MTQQTTFTHQNGLKQITFDECGHNSKQQTVFSAVFAVPTPTLDNSGIAHAVEHLIFRRSDLFPHPESLFQLTALTDLKINATTEENVTYFHCQSHDIDIFALGLNFLLHGILASNFNADDVKQEVYDDIDYGVINRELNILANDKQYKYKMAINDAFSQSLDNHWHYDEYVGNKTTIAKITFADVLDYYQRFYRVNNIVLMTENVKTTLIAQLIAGLHNDEFADPNVRFAKVVKRKEKSKAICEDNTTANSSYSVVRFILASHFYCYCQSVASLLSAELKKHSATLIQPMLQSVDYDYDYDYDSDCFCFDVVISAAKNKEDVIAHTQAFLTRHYDGFVINGCTEARPQKAEPQNTEPQNTGQTINTKEKSRKYPSNIAKLMSVYQEDIKPANEKIALDSQQNIKSVLPTKFSVNEIKQSVIFVQGKQTKPLPADYRPVNTAIIMDGCNSYLFQQLQKLAAKKPLSWLKSVINNKNTTKKIPRIILPLFDQAEEKLNSTAKNIQNAYNKQHAVLLIKVDEVARQFMAEITSAIINAYPRFLAARCQGHCYTINCMYLADKQALLLYSAFDVNPVARLEDINNTLSILQTDDKFLSMIYPLIQFRYNNENLSFQELTSYIKTML